MPSPSRSDPRHCRRRHTRIRRGGRAQQASSRSSSSAARSTKRCSAPTVTRGNPESTYLAAQALVKMDNNGGAGERVRQPARDARRRLEGDRRIGRGPDQRRSRRAPRSREPRRRANGDNPYAHYQAGLVASRQNRFQDAARRVQARHRAQARPRLRALLRRHRGAAHQADRDRCRAPRALPAARARRAGARRRHRDPAHAPAPSRCHQREHEG